MNVISLRINEAINNNEISLLQKFDQLFDGQLLMLNTIQNLFNSPLLNCEKINNPAADEESWDKFGKYLEC